MHRRLGGTYSPLGAVTDGIPYFLQDQRPGGFLGRAVPHRFPELGLPQRVVDWTDDHYLQYLTQRGADAVGDLILGDEAFNQYIELQKQRTPIEPEARRTEFPRLARDVMTGGLPGSCAHGEHPKFTTLLRRGNDYQHLLVKFFTGTAVGQRWSDLLVAEHLTHELLSRNGVSTARSEIHQLWVASAARLHRDRRIDAPKRRDRCSCFRTRRPDG